MENCYLSFQIGFEKKTVYRLQGPTTIGRGSDNTITVPVPSVSRNHAKVTLKGDTWVVEDLKSANGIVIDGKLVDKFTLKSNDTFKLGEVEFSFMEREISESEDQLKDTIQILSPVEGLDVLGEKEEPELSFERIREAVAAIPFFKPLNEVELRELADAAELHGFSAGEIVIKEGDSARSMYVILNGRVRVFTRDYKGDEEEFAILEAGQFFGEMSFLTGKSRSAYVSALDISMLMELSFTSMRKLIRANIKVKEVLMDYYRDRQRTAKENGDKMG